jgi:tetratricopeptide (TPR) repeat protein
MSDKVPEITADMVAERLSNLVIDEGAGPTPVELAYREAAAVLACFDPDKLRPVDVQPDADALAALLRVCEPVYGPRGRQEWRLPEVLRRETLERFHDDETLRRSVAANAVEGGPVQRMLSAYLTRSAPPLDAQPYEDLLAAAQVTVWLHGIVQGVPEPKAVQDRLAIAEMLAPMRRLVGSSFRGRVDVLERLHDYTDILPPGSRVKAVRRRLRRFLSLSEHPPLVLYGPGGVGKSTVLAKFMLDHAEADSDHRIPFVYIDFDRPGMLPQEPLTLLVDALHQVGVLYPAARARAEALRATWLKRVSQPDFGLLASAVIDPPTQLAERSPDVPEAIKLRASVSRRQPFYQEFADLVVANFTDQPLLFTLDTFETVQRYGVDIVQEVWEFLDGLQRELPSLRVVIASRAPLDGYPTQPVKLAGFDPESARGFLASLLGEELAADAELVDHILQVVGRNPLSLRLAADLVVKYGANELDSIGSRRVLFVLVRTEQIQGWLYRRILDRIRDDDVRALAHPGLVVRRLTADVVRYVLAGPCKVNVPDDARARELFDACSREVSLLSWNTDGSLEHRGDIRAEMLPMLRRTAPDTVAAIHSAAISYYQQHGDITSRAEEVYHRLCLGEPADSLDERWQRGVENYLAMSLDELPAEGQIYLASRLGITLPPEVLDKVRLIEQERHTATRVRQLLRFGEFDKALVVLRHQQDRTHNSPLDVLEARVLEELGRLDEASQVLDRASQRAAEAGDAETLLQLQYTASRVAERQGRSDRALELLATARAAAVEPIDRLMPLRLWTAELRVLRMAAAKSQPEAGQPASSPEASAGRQQLLRLLDATPVEQVAHDPALLVELAGELGKDRPTLVVRALLNIGLPELSESQVAEFAVALARWDARNGRQPRVRLRLLEKSEEDADVWVQWLQSTSPPAVTEALAEILSRYPSNSEPVIALVSKLYRESLASAEA